MINEGFVRFPSVMVMQTLVDHELLSHWTPTRFFHPFKLPRFLRPHTPTQSEWMILVLPTREKGFGF